MSSTATKTYEGKEYVPEYDTVTASATTVAEAAARSSARRAEEKAAKTIDSPPPAAASKLADVEKIDVEDGSPRYATSSKIPPMPPQTPRGRSSYVLKKTMTIPGDRHSSVYCVKYSPDGAFLAAGCGDGAIRIYASETGKLVYNLNVESMTQLPTTSIRFRPTSGRSKTKNVLLAVNADGSLDHWHITSGRKLHTIAEKDNQLLCVDYRYDGGAFATAGKDYNVRIYDEATKTRISVLSSGMGNQGGGHSNRVFSLKFKPRSQDILVSGGWDNTVQIWDLRMGSAVRSFYGPHICGDSVDIVGDKILTGSWSRKDVLQTWDLGSGKLMESIPFADGGSKSNTQIYSAQFSKFGTKPGHFIAAGGSGVNEGRVFDTSKGNAIVGVVQGLRGAVYTTDFSPSDHAVAFAGGSGAIHTFSIVPRVGDVSELTTREYRESTTINVLA